MAVDHCPARAEPGPHHFTEYAPPRPENLWGTTKWTTPVAVYCRWCGAWSSLTEGVPAPADIPEPMEPQ